MSTGDEPFSFSEPASGDAPSEGLPWNILIVDDEPGVHEVTEFALKRVTFRDRPIQFFHAYSGAEAIQKFKSINDLALIFLDVVMETDDAGLRVVRELREDLDERTVRIILRTGQPGVAPERKVIVDYDINDYKAKTELSTDKLFVATIGALRAYEDLKTIEELKKLAFTTLAHETGLEQQLLDALPLAMLHTDKLLSITGLNTKAASILKGSPETLLGRTLHALLGAEATTKIAGHREMREIKLSAAIAGSPQSVAIYATPYILADGDQGGYILRLDSAP